MIVSFIYFTIRPFGAEAQAGFGVGMRVLQAIFLPAMSVAFAVAPIVGQNFGAGKFARVRATFRSAAAMSSVLMLLAMLLLLWRGESMIAGFTSDPEAIRVGAEYLRFVSWNCIASGFVFTCSGVLQGLGNTWPSLWSSASRLLTFVLPVAWLAAQPGFTLHQVWITSVASVTLQAVLSGTLVLWQLRARAGG
jgi:Na+-driven multidrug efflux pump